MANVNFTVTELVKANKAGYVHITVMFNTSPKLYKYTRKAYNGFCLIDGCKIEFDNNYNVTNIERIYDTHCKSKVKTTTDFNKETAKISEKIKHEMHEEKIEKPLIDYTKTVRHDKYDDIKTCIDNDIPVYLAGPAGSGKNHVLEQIAKENGYDFYFTNSIQQEFKLTGFIDAGGNYHETEFYKACTSENDCIFFLDEMDASIPEVLVLLNMAIANGYFEFPTGRVELKNVKFVAAGNTTGNGADEMYTGRMVIDSATLDRFAIIDFGYCTDIEMVISENNRELVTFIHELRNQSEQQGIRATYSYRCIAMVTKLEKAGMNIQAIIKMAVVKGLDCDTINTYRTHDIDNKYMQALKNIQQAA